MILNEKDYIGGLKQWAGNHMKAAKDTAMVAAGSKTAVGRLNIRATTDKLIADWKAFCGEREQAGVQGWDKYDPTMTQIEQFLKTRYGVDASGLTDKPDVAQAAEAAGVEEGEPAADESGQADDDAENQALAADKEATTPDEVAHLKKLAAGDNVRAANPAGPAKPRPEADPELSAQKKLLKTKMNRGIVKDKMRGLPTKESVELTEAGRGDLLRKLFGTIALHMFDQGLVNVTRGKNGKLTVHNNRGANPASDQADDNGPVADAEKGTKIETRVDNNGYYLNAIKLRDNLKRQGIDGVMIKELKQAVKSSALGTMFKNADPGDKERMVKIAAATVASIQRAKSVMTAGENVTSDGNTVNFNAFMVALKKNKVANNAFILATARLNKASADGEIDQADVQAVMGNGDETARAVLAIMGAMVTAIEGVGKAKPAAAKAAPDASVAPAPEQKAEAE